MKHNFYPMRLEGVMKSPIWGGTRLLKDYGKRADRETVGESWELTVRRAEVSRVTNGAYAGMALDQLIRDCKDAMTGSDFGADDFPLLIKLIDANDRLSVQVHPDDVYAKEVENDRGKTEMWYIVEADEGAEIISGLADGVDAEGFAEAVRAGRIDSALHHQPVRAGETYFIPAGLAHAIGRGILIAEIQQNCDLTYRVYDYDRRDAAGNLRELHVDKALDVTKPFTAEQIDAIRYETASERTPELLAACRFFRVEKIELHNAERNVEPNGVMKHLLILDDGITLQYDGIAYATQKGESWLLPAALTSVTLSGTGTVLVSGVR